MRDTRMLISSVGISALGDMLLGIPLALHVQALTGSALAVSAFFLALWGPSVVLAGVAGLAVDRWENTRLLAVVSLLQAVAACGLLAAGSLPAILALTALLGAGAAVGQAAEFALVPAVAGEERIARTNGHVEAARYLGMTAGPALGGVLAGAGLLDLAIAVDAGSFVFVAAVALTLRARRAPAADGRERAWAGAAVLLADRTLAVTLAAAVGALAFFTISATAEVFFATDVLGAGGAGWGLMLTAWTVGMVAGAVGLARRVPRAWLATGALAAVAVQGFGIAGASTAGVLWVAMAGCAVGGLGHGIKNVLLRTRIHQHVTDAVRGRAFAAYNAARNAAELGALGAGGVLVGLVGARAALAIAGLVPLAIGVLALLTVGRRQAPGSTTRRTAYAHVQG
jgi:Na+/melibiose symporter-like transporter